MGNRVDSNAYRVNRTASCKIKRVTRYALQRIFFLLGTLLFQHSSFANERIVSLNACTDELLLQLADPAQIVGVTHFQHSPPSERILSEHPHIAQVSSDVEEILQLQPSLVLAGAFSSPLLLEQLRKAGIAVAVVQTPGNWPELIGVAEQISKLTGELEPVEKLKNKIDELQQFSANLKRQKRTAVFWSAAGHVSGRGTFEETILKTLGLQNKIEFDGYGFLSLEKLIQLKPDVIVVTQNSKERNSWSHDTLFHPALTAALPELKYIEVPETAASCASGYTAESLIALLKGTA